MKKPEKQKDTTDILSKLPPIKAILQLNNEIKINTESELQCGNVQSIPDLSGRILGGNEAKANNYNWMVIMITELQNRKRFMCGGNIISETKILTAAHCVKNAKRIRIYYGAHQLTKARNYVDMKSYVVHENYGFPNHDIAIITVQEPLEYR